MTLERTDKTLSITASILTIGSVVAALFFSLLASPNNSNTATQPPVTSTSDQQEEARTQPTVLDKTSKGFAYWQVVQLILNSIVCGLIFAVILYPPLQRFGGDLLGEIGNNAPGCLGCSIIIFIGVLLSSLLFLGTVLCISIAEEHLAFSKWFLIRSFLLSGIFFFTLGGVAKIIGMFFIEKT